MSKIRFIHSKKDFHQKRAKTIGASDIPVILGLLLHIPLTPFDLWQEKTGRKARNQEINDAIEFGHAHEPTILRRAVRDIAGEETSHRFLVDYIQHENERPLDWKPATPFYPFTFFTHPDVDAFTASPDCIFEWEGVKGIREAKSGRLFANIRRDQTTYDGYDPDNLTEEGIPMKVYVQVQWQSFVMQNKYPDMQIRALIDTSMDLAYPIKPNIKVQNELVKYAERFLWHIKKEIPPEPLNIKDITTLLPSREDKVLIVHGKKADELQKIVNKKHTLKKVIKDCEIKVTDINQSLLLAMKEYGYLETSKGDKLATQISQERYANIGVGAIQKQHPQIFEALEKAGYIKTNHIRYVR